MPPQRTIPPAKAIKTERTHEENQERAYIAASRRSDRSLEARVESARRASEIHKRRTGRGLRVTEQDVVNEEMYEEEDDDLPLQYRRLTAHLQTGSADFNRRLSAYLTNHVAMRSALDQAITNSYAQTYPNAQFNQGPSLYQSPMLPHQQQQMMQQQNSYRQQPYPSSGMPRAGFRPSLQHQRSASIATPHEVTGATVSSPVATTDSRRLSLPATSAETSPSTDGTSQSSVDTPQSRPAVPTGGFNKSYTGAGMQDFYGFSTALPAEAQMLLGNTLDSNDPLTSMFMAGSDNFPQYNFGASLQQPTSFDLSMGKLGGPQMYPSFDGLNSTLAQAQGVAPSQLDLCAPSQPSFFDAGMLESGGGSKAGTPGNNASWDLFMDNDKWDLPASQ